ncbi:MAG: Rieske 2Fe-2S domain-containing protein [Armatimonadetes bacterium]|nr:Rieske 2Fe-2S domain-containing protein [Anaerolineae bacterium]
MLLGQLGAGIIWFALPRFKEGEFGGTFRFTGGDLPLPGDDPTSIPSGRFWLSNGDAGFMALYGVCTHLGCLPKWETANNRFACPCHGSQYQKDGTWITGPAPRPLDVFPTVITLKNGTQRTTEIDLATGVPLPIPFTDFTVDEIADVAIDTGKRIKRPNNA